MVKSSESSDPDLIEAALDGDQQAWSELVRRQAPLIWSVCRGCGLGRADAEDVAQVVFAAMIRRLPHLRNRSALSGWVVMTCKRESWRVSARNRRRATDPIEGCAEVDGAETDAEVHERQQAVREALRALDPICRDLLNQLFGQADSPAYGQVAERLGIAPNSIGPTRRRCLDKVLATLHGAHKHLF